MIQLNGKMAIILLVAIPLFSGAIPPSIDGHQHDLIKFNHVFETGGYNFDITQDKDGFIWVGTINGLKVFNGYEVKSFKAGINTFPSNNIRTIFTDSEGLIWLATFGGLAMYDKNTDKFTTYLTDPENPHAINSNVFNGSPNLIAESRDGMLWFGTANGLNRFNKKTKRFSHYQHDSADRNSLSDNDILAVFHGSDGLIWIGTKGGGLNQFNRKTLSFIHYKHDPRNPDKSRDIGAGEVNVIAEDGDGNLWIGMSESGLKKFDKKTGIFTHYQHDPNDPASLANNNVRVIIPTSDGSLWLCHPYWVSVGIERFDRTSGKFTQYKHELKDPDRSISDRVQVAFEDATGILWIGENLSTISTYDKHYYKFNLYKPNSNDQNSVVSNVIAIVEDQNKDIWLGSGTEGIVKYDKERDNFINYSVNPDVPDDKNVTTMYVDSSHNFWVTTNNGMLGLFDVQTGKFLKRYYHPKLVEVWSMLEDPRYPDILWFGTENNGIYKFDKQTEKFSGYQPEGRNKMLLHTLGVHADHESNLWFTNESNGLIRYDPKTDRFKAYQHDDGDPKSISSNNINFFFVSTTGTIWVSTQNGLNKFDSDTQTFTIYGKNNGLEANLRGMLEDENGFLWISSDAGLFKFDPETEKVVRTYEEGGREFNFSPISVLKTTDGQMWFSSNKGVIRFNPGEVKDNPVIPPVYFTSITQSGENLAGALAPEHIRRIELDWQRNFFEFEFVALNYTRSERNLYAYKLEGVDKGWHQAGTRRYGRYSGLPGGHYTLRVKGSNNDGIWNRQGASLHVKVTAPWWETGFFLASAASLLIVGAICIYLLRVRAVKAINLELEKRVKEKTRALQDALDNISTLKGLVPICSNCKKIRDDKGYWNHLESYIEAHSDAQFSHGICQECADKLYGDEEWYREERS